MNEAAVVAGAGIAPERVLGGGGAGFSCDRLGCKNPKKGRRRHGRFCSAACRSAVHKDPKLDGRAARLAAEGAARQTVLCLDPAPPFAALSPAPPAGDPAKDRPRLRTAALRILGRLDKGPATGDELAAPGIGGRRFSARILEIRAAGHYLVGPVPARRFGILETTTEPDTFELRERPAEVHS